MSNLRDTNDNHFMAAALRAAREGRQARAAERAKLAPVVKALQADGITSLNGIAAALVSQPLAVALIGMRCRLRAC